MEHAPIDPAILRAALRGDRGAQRTLWRAVLPLHAQAGADTRREMERVGAQARRAAASSRGCCARTGRARCTARPGMRRRLRGTAYLLTLDADTRLTPGAARALAGAMLHPLNRAGRGRAARSGHARLRSAAPAHGHRAAERDVPPTGRACSPVPAAADPYGGACGELYMDCFDRGGFTGKGIIDARALLDCCGGGVMPGSGACSATTRLRAHTCTAAFSATWS